MSRKLKVSTRSSSMYQKRDKILRCLGAYPEGTTPKNISFHTSINVNTVKSILPRLKGVRKIMRGFYKVVEKGDSPFNDAEGELVDWNFHNLVLSSVLVGFPERLIHSTLSLGLVNCEFMISTSGRASLRVACDTPLNVASIGVVFGLFVKLVGEYSNDVVLEKDVWVRTVEFNKDYSNLRMDGVRCVTVDNLCAQFKVYQKRRGLRVEHKTKVPLSVENLVDMLRSNPSSLDHNVKLAGLKEQLDRQVLATERNTQILYKLIENLKEVQENE